MKRNLSDSDLYTLSKKAKFSPKSLLKNYKEKEIETLKAEKIYLENELTTLKQKIEKSQVEKSKIQNFLYSILAIDLSNEVLVDINFNEQSNDLTVIGRPKVLGSASRQMRHVTPYSFITQLIESQLQNSPSPQKLLQTLMKNAIQFIHKEEGVCIVKSLYDQRSSEKEIYKTKIITSNNTYYLITQEQIEENEEIFAHITFTEDMKIDYQKRRESFFHYSISLLEEALEDKNTINIACESIARYTFTLFNQRPHAAFPKEYNTLDYEMRLYDTPEKANQPKKNPYKVVTLIEIKEKLSSREDLNRKIRIVDNEGSKVLKAKEALNLLTSIFINYETDIPYEEELLRYNEHFNQELKLSRLSFHQINDTLEAQTQNFLLDYNGILNEEKILNLFPYHIAKHLYSVFDFKPLEIEVFAPAPRFEPNITKVFPSASGSHLAEYSLQKGEDYRKAQKNQASGYNNLVKFRQEETDSDLLAEKIVDHVIIFLATCYSFEDTAKESSSKIILEAFTKLMALDYNLTFKELSDLVYKQNNWQRFFSEKSNIKYSPVIKATTLIGHEPVEEDISQMLVSGKEVDHSQLLYDN